MGWTGYWQVVLAGMLPLIFILLSGGKYIDFLRRKYMGQYIREDGPQSHQSKAGTPTAGGVLIMASFLLTVLVLAALKGGTFLTVPVLLVVGVTLVFALLGFVDDYMKIAKKHNKGVSGYTKLAVQVISGLLVGWVMLRQDPTGAVSLFGLTTVQLGILYPLFTAFVITACSNALNLTDGLDGLASGTATISFMCLFLILMFASQTPHPDLAMVSLILAGACMGFLYHNRYPARVFMGDTGSLALGGALGAIAVTARLEFWLTFLAAIFILEALSVILQVISFKTTGKRIFRMSPLHHHFELGGWKETKVVFSFVTFQFLCCVLAVFLYRG